MPGIFRLSNAPDHLAGFVVLVDSLTAFSVGSSPSSCSLRVTLQLRQWADHQDRHARIDEDSTVSMCRAGKLCSVVQPCSHDASTAGGCAR